MTATPVSNWPEIPSDTRPGSDTSLDLDAFLDSVLIQDPVSLRSELVPPALALGLGLCSDGYSNGQQGSNGRKQGSGRAVTAQAHPSTMGLPHLAVQGFPSSLNPFLATGEMKLHHDGSSAGLLTSEGRGGRAAGGGRRAPGSGAATTGAGRSGSGAGEDGRGSGKERGTGRGREAEETDGKGGIQPGGRVGGERKRVEGKRRDGSDPEASGVEAGGNGDNSPDLALAAEKQAAAAGAAAAQAAYAEQQQQQATAMAAVAQAYSQQQQQQARFMQQQAQAQAFAQAAAHGAAAAGAGMVPTQTHQHSQVHAQQAAYAQAYQQQAQQAAAAYAAAAASAGQYPGWMPMMYGYHPYFLQAQQYQQMQYEYQKSLGQASRMQQRAELEARKDGAGIAKQDGEERSKEGAITDEEDDEARAVKRPRLIWTNALHRRFLDAVGRCGGVEHALPKAVMREMAVNGLTRENVASHLQKYRLRQRKEDAEADNLLENSPLGVLRTDSKNKEDLDDAMEHLAADEAGEVDHLEDNEDARRQDEMREEEMNNFADKRQSRRHHHYHHHRRHRYHHRLHDGDSQEQQHQPQQQQGQKQEDDTIAERWKRYHQDVGSAADDNDGSHHRRCPPGSRRKSVEKNKDGLDCTVASQSSERHECRNVEKVNEGLNVQEDQTPTSVQNNAVGGGEYEVSLVAEKHGRSERNEEAHGNVAKKDEEPSEIKLEGKSRGKRPLRSSRSKRTKSAV